MTGCEAEGKHPFSPPCQAKSNEPINVIFWSRDYVRELTPYTKIGKDRMFGGFSGNGWNITIQIPFSFSSSNSPTGQTVGAINTYRTPNDVVWAKEVPFGGPIFEKICLGVKITQISPKKGRGQAFSSQI